MRLVVRPLADADTDSAADYLAREANLDVALRFLSALDSAYDRSGSVPDPG
jgi:plasmid stabilization system protein ParE